MRNGLKFLSSKQPSGVIPLFVFSCTIMMESHYKHSIHMSQKMHLERKAIFSGQFGCQSTWPHQNACVFHLSETYGFQGLHFHSIVMKTRPWHLRMHSSSILAELTFAPDQHVKVAPCPECACPFQPYCLMHVNFIAISIRQRVYQLNAAVPEHHYIRLA